MLSGFAVPLLCGLLALGLTLASNEVRGEAFRSEQHEQSAGVVSASITSNLVGFSQTQSEQRTVVRSLTPVALATAEAAIPCNPPAITTPTPTPASDFDDSSFLGPTPTPAPEPDAVVDPLLQSMTSTAIANLQACWNAADWDAVATILTPRFLQTALGITTLETAEQAKALAALELGPLHIELIRPVSIWSDGRGAVEVHYVRGRGNPVQAVAARWFLIAERGVVRFDEEVLLPPPLWGDRVTIGFAIADDLQPLQWASPASSQIFVSPVTALHGVNRGWERHTFILEGAGGRTLGVLTLPSWRQGNLVLLDLPTGTYRLYDPAVPGSEVLLEVIP